MLRPQWQVETCKPQAPRWLRLCRKDPLHGPQCGRKALTVSPDFWCGGLCYNRHCIPTHNVGSDLRRVILSPVSTNLPRAKLVRPLQLGSTAAQVSTSNERVLAGRNQ